jgi:hypothetical protein
MAYYDVTNAAGSAMTLSANPELISVMREVVTDILNKPITAYGYTNVFDPEIFEQMSEPTLIVNKFGIQGGGLFEDTKELENFKKDALKTLPLLSFVADKKAKMYPISEEYARAAQMGNYSKMGLVAAEAGRAAKATLQKMGATVYANSLTTLGADGVPMLAATALTGNTHPGYGDNLVASAVAGLANVTLADIDNLINLMLLTSNRQGSAPAGFAGRVLLVAPEAMNHFNTLLKSMTYVGQDNPSVINYIANTYGIRVATMQELSSKFNPIAGISSITIGGTPATGIAFLLSDAHSIFNAQGIPFEAWIRDYKQSDNFQDNYMAVFHNIFGFYDGFGVAGLVY